MIWSAIAYNTRSPLVLIRCTMTSQLYVHDILLPHVIPLMQWLSLAIFQQDNDRPHKTVSALLLSFLGLPNPQICLQWSISGIILDGDLGTTRV
ncbi:uncharacterized protein TNCV_1358691 [Trichonephila clavipes]|uniref:Uncharacterized protein n=1 Tax=Trichonephila clavipes TaxID=2585209 RepID=A0A8X6VJN9_TRICX|nr:uncharacterized protein TNCV_1358691 [Trichonephila clavipes]